MDKQTLTKEIESVKDPSTETTLGENNAIRHIEIDEEGLVTLIIGIGEEDDHAKRVIKRDLARKIKLELGFKGVRIEFEPLRKKDSVLDEKRDVTYIAVASGKGGVGKSTVAANLALSLKRIGKKVAIIDADIYGSNIPVIMDMPIEAPKSDENKKIVPFSKHGIEVISTEFFLKDDKPVMWRGPMLSKMLNHFFYDVGWDDDTEYIIIDLPPGTGDVAIDIQKLIPECKMLIVSTPHPSASNVAVKAGVMAKELDHEILGVVENMTHLSHNGETLKIFGEGGGEMVAEHLDVPLIQQIPIGQPESGHHSLFASDEEIGILYLGLANKVLKAL